MLALVKLWKVGLGLLAGLLIGWFVMAPVARESGRASGFEAGRTVGVSEERIAHEEARRIAEAKAEADRRIAQARIDAIERSYHERTAEQAMQLDALEASILQETSREPIPPVVGAPRACPAAVPRSLRDALARLGTAAPRDDPTIPHAPVR